MTANFNHEFGPMGINKMALGQGGLSSDPMWESRVAEVRALNPAIIRFWAQEYFKPMSKAEPWGVHSWYIHGTDWDVDA